jgi:two-component system, OmpR family, sensor kinase
MSIRARIALLSGALTLVILLSIGAGVYFTLQRSLNQEIDNRLYSVVVTVTKHGSVVQAPDGTIGVGIPPLDPFASPGLYIQVTDVRGAGQQQAPDLGRQYMPLPDDVLQQNLKRKSSYYSAEFGDVPVRVFSAPLIDPAGQVLGTIQAVQPLNATLKTMRTLRLLFLAGLVLGLLIAAVGAYIFSGRSLRPLTGITSAARRIGRSRDLSERLELPRSNDEVQDLVETFNTMLDRLDDAFTAERRFVSDASHELRTPLTALRGNAEILLRQIAMGSVENSDAVEILTDIRDESERMGRLVQNLLTLARADVGWRPDLGPVQLDQIAYDSARLATRISGTHKLDVEIDGEVDVIGNADQLKQLLLILLDNAFTYTPEGSGVSLVVTNHEDEAEILVNDSGPGIPAEQLERIFDRFFRGEAARDKRAVGAGLGLAIARWIVDCHNGTIGATSVIGVGTTVIVTLPRVTDAEGTDGDTALEPLSQPAAIGAGS